MLKFVEIYDGDSETPYKPYIAYTPDDCKDSVDRMCFNMAVELGDVASCGMVSAVPHFDV